MKHTVVLAAQEGIPANGVGIVVEWKREIGDFVSADAPLLVVGSAEVCAGVYGVLHRKFVLPGDAVEVGEPLALLAGVPEPIPTDTNTTTVSPPYIPDGPEEIRYLTTREQAIAQHLAYSAQMVPQTHTVVRVDMSEVLRLAERVGGDTLPFLAHVVAATLLRYPELNAQLLPPNELRLKEYVHLATPFRASSGRLVAPVLRDANTKSLMALVREHNEFRRATETGSLSDQSQQGATFTVQAVPTPGFHAPLLHLPHTGFLVVGQPEPTPLALPDSTIAVRPIAHLCLVSDARVVSEETASAFLTTVRAGVEDAQFLFA